MKPDKIIRGLLSVPYLLLLWIVELEERGASDLPSSATNARVEAVAALLRHAEYSFQPIDWDYSILTPSEKSLISPEEFEAIRKMIASPVSETQP